MCLTMTACSNDKETISELQNNIAGLQQNISELQADKDKTVEELQQQISELQDTISDLERENSTLTSDTEKYLEQIDELENGASRQLTAILNAYEAGDYEKTISLARAFHKQYNGTPEDTEAQNTLKLAQAEINRIEAEKKAEEARKAAELAKSTEQKVHEIIQVHELNIDEIDSAGGVDVEIAWTNKSSKTVKYITFVVAPYNAVGDLVHSEIGNKTSVRLQETGPIATGEGSKWFDSIYADLRGWIGSYWSNVWYNYSVDTLKFEGIEIEYMDGTTEEIKGDALNYVFW